MFKDDDDEEENTFGVTRYPCMPSLVALQQMRNRLHLAFLGRKLMKWTALATGREMRRLAQELYELYQGFGEDMRNAFIMLARARYFCPQLNFIVTEDVCKQAGVVVQQNSKSISGVKIVQFEIFETQYPPYAHLGIEKGGQAILEAKKAWLDLLKRLIMMMQLRASFLMVELANRNATKKWNVLSKMVVPRIKLSCHYILSELEEIEREDNFRLKRFKELKYKTTKGKVKPSNKKDEDEFSGLVSEDKINSEENIADQSEVMNPLMDSEVQDSQHKKLSPLLNENDDKNIEFIDQREILSKANLQDSDMDKQVMENVESTKSLPWRSSVGLASSCPSCMKKEAKSIEFIIEPEIKTPLESYIFSRVRSVCANCRNWKHNEGFLNNNFIDVRWMMPGSQKDEQMNISQIEFIDQREIKSLADISQLKNSERIKLKRIEFLDQRKVKSLIDLPESLKTNVNEEKLICPYCQNELNSKLLFQNIRHSSSPPCPGCNNNNELIQKIDITDQREIKYLPDITLPSKLQESEDRILTNNSEFKNIKEVYPGCKSYYMKIKSFEFIKQRNSNFPIEILPSSQMKNLENRLRVNCSSADTSKFISNVSDSNIQMVYPGCKKYYMRVKSIKSFEKSYLLCPNCESEELNEVNFKDSNLNNNDQIICPNCKNDLLLHNSLSKNFKTVYPGCKNYYNENKSTESINQPKSQSSTGISKLIENEDQTLCPKCRNKRKNEELIKKAKFENIKMVYLGYKYYPNRSKNIEFIDQRQLKQPIEISSSFTVNYLEDKSSYPDCANMHKENNIIEFSNEQDFKSPLESYIFSRVKGTCSNCRDWKQIEGRANNNNKNLDIWWVMPDCKRNEVRKRIRAIEFIDQREIKSLTDIEQLKNYEMNNKRNEYLSYRKFKSMTGLSEQKKLCTNWQNEIQNQVLIKNIQNAATNEEKINKEIEIIDQRDKNFIADNTVSLKSKEYAFCPVCSNTNINKSLTNNLEYKNIKEAYSGCENCSMNMKKVEFIDQRDIESLTKFPTLNENKSLQDGNLCPNCRNRNRKYEVNGKALYLDNNKMTCPRCKNKNFVKSKEFINNREKNKSLTDTPQLKTYEECNEKIKFLEQRQIKSLTDLQKSYNTNITEEKNVCTYCQNEQKNQSLIKTTRNTMSQLCPSCNNNCVNKVKDIEFIDQRNNNFPPDTATSLKMNELLEDSLHPYNLELKNIKTIYPTCKNCYNNVKRIEFIDQRDVESPKVGIVCPSCKYNYLIKNIEFIDQRDFETPTKFPKLVTHKSLEDDNRCPQCSNSINDEAYAKVSFGETCPSCKNVYLVKRIEFIDQREIRSLTDFKNYEINNKRIEFLDQRKVKSLADLPKKCKTKEADDNKLCPNCKKEQQNQLLIKNITNKTPQLCFNCNNIKPKNIEFIDQRISNFEPDIAMTLKLNGSQKYASCYSEFKNDKVVSPNRSCENCYYNNFNKIESTIDQRELPTTTAVCVGCKNNYLVKNIEFIDQRDFDLPIKFQKLFKKNNLKVNLCPNCRNKKNNEVQNKYSCSNTKIVCHVCNNNKLKKNIEFIDQREVKSATDSSQLRNNENINRKGIEFLDQRKIKSVPDLQKKFTTNITQERYPCSNCQNVKQNQLILNNTRNTTSQFCFNCNNEMTKLKEIKFIDQCNINILPGVTKNSKDVLAGCKNCDINFKRIEFIDQRDIESPMYVMICPKCKNDYSVKKIDVIDQHDNEQHFKILENTYPGCENCSKIKNIKFIDQREMDQPSQNYFIVTPKQPKLGTLNDSYSGNTEGKIEFIDQSENSSYNTKNRSAHNCFNQFVRAPTCISSKINPAISSNTSDMSILQSLQNYEEGRSASELNSIASTKNCNININKDSTDLCCFAKSLHTPRKSTKDNMGEMVKTIKESITINTSPDTIRISRKEVQVTTTGSKGPIVKSSSEMCTNSTITRNLTPKITSEDSKKKFRSGGNFKIPNFISPKPSKQYESQISNKKTYTFTNDKATQCSETTILINNLSKASIISIKSKTKSKKGKTESTKSRCKIKIKTKNNKTDENNVVEEIKLTPSSIFTLRKVLSSASKTDTNKNTCNINKTGSTERNNSNLKLIDSKYKHAKSVLIITDSISNKVSESCDLKKVIKVYEIQSHDKNYELLKKDTKLTCKCSKNKEPIENCCCNLQRSESSNKIKSLRNGCLCKSQCSDGVTSLSKSYLENYSESEEFSSQTHNCTESRRNLEESQIRLCSTAPRYSIKTCNWDNVSAACNNTCDKMLKCKSTDFINCDCNDISYFKKCSCKFIKPHRSSESLLVRCQPCSGFTSSQVSQKSIRFSSDAALRSQSINSEKFLSTKDSKCSLCCKSSSYSFQDCLSRQTLCSCLKKDTSTSTRKSYRYDVRTLSLLRPKIFDYPFMVSDSTCRVFECKKSRSDSHSDVSM